MFGLFRALEAIENATLPAPLALEVLRKVVFGSMKGVPSGEDTEQTYAIRWGIKFDEEKQNAIFFHYYKKFLFACCLRWFLFFSPSPLLSSLMTFESLPRPLQASLLRETVKVNAATCLFLPGCWRWPHVSALKAFAARWRPFVTPAADRWR